MTISLVIDPRDPEMVRPFTADGSRVLSASASIRPSRDGVRLASGGFLVGILPAREAATTADSPITFSVPATDGTEIHEADRSTFEYIVDVEIGGGNARRAHGGAQTVTFQGLLPQSLGTTVQVTALLPGESLPPPYVTVADLADKVTSAEAAATAAAAASKFPKGVLPDGTDINTVRTPGVYTVTSTTSAGTMLNWPSARPGTLLVGKNDTSNATTQDVILYMSTTEPAARFSRANNAVSNTAWSPWNSTAWTKGVLPASSSTPIDVDTYRSPGAWAVSSRTYVTNLPGTATGVLEVHVFDSTGLSFQRYTERVANSTVKVWHRYTATAAGWAGIAWELLAPPPSTTPVSDVQVSDHATRVECARARRGGGIGTGGKAVIMLRFDHWMLAFRDTVLPILRTYSLPGTLNVNYDNIGNSQNGGGAITWAHVQDWNQYDGIEIANHGATHTDASTRATIYHEVVEGRRLLETAMPRVAVETWHEHGSAYLTASDIPGDPGLNLGRTPSSFTESYAGRLVMAEHAVVEGKNGGFFVPLSGSPVVGQSHISAEQTPIADVLALVDTAKTLGRGVTLYFHPGMLGTGTPYMSVTDFTTLCAYLASERAAGNIMVMTAAGGAFADRTHSRRENLLTKADFTTGYTDWWSGTAGWAIANPGDNVTLTSGGIPSTLTQSMLLHSRFGWAMGAAHELVVRVKASVASSLTLTVDKLGDAATWQAQKVHAIPGDNVERDYRLNLTLPRDPNITQMSVRIGGANLTIVGPPRLVAI